MYELNKYQEYIKEKLSESRYEHSLRVVDMAMKLAKKHQANEEEVKVAALLHDCAKYKSFEKTVKKAQKYNLVEEFLKYEAVLHSAVGAMVAKDKFNIKNEDILNAIRYHTTGRENMTLVEKIVYIADAIEVGRDYPEVEELRNMAFEDLDKAIIECMNQTIHYLLDSGQILHETTIRARNYMIAHRKLK